ncbi:MAG: hypothetical protein DI586_03105 [Micavibrio aeruginosavorus]|uniref:Uncharacterized protein n=1 Tax=Micavibrio aeruginosavorus TaxID=349221 RepID=A0A2W5FQC1_9BACT|nr:MAG: hypothetical protein DI586_03105 [Micavibrio aeruginosavorus]
MKNIARNFLMIDIPLLLMMGQVLVEIFVPNTEKAAFHSEGGPHEAIEAFFLVFAFPVALFLTFKVKNFWLKIWAGIAALCCFYVAGEEISWGQQIFHWGTPENWAAINDQNETNLHNTSTWLDQKPRAILEIGVLIGGLIIPALRKWKPERLPQRFKEIYPGNIVVFTAICAVIVKLIGIYGDTTGHHLFWRVSEVMELYLYYFVLLYLIDRKFSWKEQGLI